MKRLAVVVLNGCYSSNASYLLDIAQIANHHIDAAGTPVAGIPVAGEPNEARIACDVVSLNGRPAQSTEGFAIAPTLSVDAAVAQYDLIFVPASDYPDSSVFFDRLASFKSLYPWLVRQWQGGAIVASLCTGTFVLAEAGLLDGRLATTSWWLEKQFHRCYPAVKLDITRDLTESERMVCGSTLGVGAQLSLKLIDMLTSPKIAEATARSVIFDAHAEAIDAPESSENADELVARAQGWFAKNLEKKIKLADAADCMQVSERTLIRHFKKKLGITPHAYLQNIRIESAKRMLQDTNLRIGKVAERVGYSDVAFFQQVFRSHVGVSPTVFRSNAARSQASHRATY